MIDTNAQVGQGQDAHPKGQRRLPGSSTTWLMCEDEVEASQVGAR